MKGSFSIPDDIKKAVDESKNKNKNKKQTENTEGPVLSNEDNYVDSESIPEPKEKKEEASKEKSVEADDDAKVEKILKKLDIEITEDDVWKILLGNRLTKDVCLVKGKFYATFQNLHMDDTIAIDEEMAVVLEKKMLEEGFRQKRNLKLYARGILRLGRSKDLLKPLAPSTEEREKYFNTLPLQTFSVLTLAWNEFSYALNYVFEREVSRKNS